MRENGCKRPVNIIAVAQGFENVVKIGNERDEPVGDGKEDNGAEAGIDPTNKLTDKKMVTSPFL